MHINLSPEIEQYLQGKVDSGCYSNASEVVRDAIRRMREEDERVALLRAAVAVGDEQLARGEGVTYGPTLLKQITGNALENARKGKTVSADVRS